MIKKLFIFIAMQMLLFGSFNVDSIYGKFKTVDDGDNITSYIELNEKIIHKYEGNINIIKKYNTQNSEIYIIVTNLGGNGTIDYYFIVEIFKDGIYKISKEFVDMNGEPKFNFKNGVLYIDLDYEKKLKKDAIYKNHKLTIIKKKEIKGYAKESDCKYLYYNIYTYYSNLKKCSKSLYDDMPMAFVRTINSMSDNPNIDTNILYKITEDDCYKRTIKSYKVFKKLVCIANSKTNNKEINIQKLEKSKNYTTSKGTMFKAQYNKHGAVLKSYTITLYIGKTCDVVSPQFGNGKWYKDIQGVHLDFNNGKNIDFPNTSILDSSNCTVNGFNNNNNNNKHVYQKNKNLLSEECTKKNIISAYVFRVTNPYKLKGKCVKGAFKIQSVVSENVALGYNLVPDYGSFQRSIKLGKRAVKITAKGNLSNKLTDGASIFGLFKVTGTDKLELSTGGEVTASAILWIRSKRIFIVQ